MITSDAPNPTSPTDEQPGETLLTERNIAVMHRQPGIEDLPGDEQDRIMDRLLDFAVGTLDRHFALAVAEIEAAEPTLRVRWEGDQC